MSCRVEGAHGVGCIPAALGLPQGKVRPCRGCRCLCGTQFLRAGSHNQGLFPCDWNFFIDRGLLKRDGVPWWLPIMSHEMPGHRGMVIYLGISGFRPVN